MRPWTVRPSDAGSPSAAAWRASSGAGRGRTAGIHFDKYLFEADPVLLRAVAEHASPLVAPDTEVLAGLELGGVPVATALSIHTGLPAAFVRKEAKSYGTMKLAEEQTSVAARY
jgi:orotate phosphoribosyltransferase